jgi:hypothetical protein
MNIKSFACAAVGAACVLAGGSAASARPITYDLVTDGDFIYEDGITNPSYVNQTFAIVATSDTSAVYDYFGLALLAPVSAASFVSGPTGIQGILLTDPSYFAHGEGPYTSVGVYGDFEHGMPVNSFQIAGPGLSAWDTVSKLAPIPVTLSIVDPNNPLRFDLLNGAAIKFTRLDPDAIFSASVPEPATWAMMLAGVALAGAALRRRRALAAA